jgi:hypothetical protein
MSAVLRYAACAKKLRGTNGLGVTKKIVCAMLDLSNSCVGMV